MRYSTFLLGMGLSTCIILQSAYAFELNYSHAYADTTQKHTDQLSFSHAFDNFNVSVGWKGQPKEQENGEPGKAFHQNEITEHRYKVKYKYKYNSQLEFSPEIQWGAKPESDKYKAKLNSTFKLNSQQKLMFKPGYEVVKYDEKPTKNVQFVELGGSQNFDRLKVTYIYAYYHSNALLFNRTHNNYKHQIAFDYKVNKKLHSYLKVTNEALSSKSDQRQTAFTTGVRYTFF